MVKIVILPRTRPPPLRADQEQVAQFIDALFRHADDNSYVSLRVFDDTRDNEDHAPLANQSVLVQDTADLIQQACQLIERAAAAKTPHVFTSPICTFRAPREIGRAHV